MQKLINEGKVRYFGLSEAGGATIRRANVVCPVAAVQNEYSLWTRDPESEVLPVCEKLGIGLVPWSPLGMGYLSGKMSPTAKLDASDLRARLPRFTDDARRANQRLIDLLETVANQKNATPGQIALAWLLARKPFIVPIPGTTRLAHLEENLGALKIELTAGDLKAIEDGFSKIGVQGARAPEDLLASVDIGAKLGTHSIDPRELS